MSEEQSNPPTGTTSTTITTTYTREWVGLTDEEVDQAWHSVNWLSDKGIVELRKDFASAIEAKLKEKNT